MTVNNGEFQASALHPAGSPELGASPEGVVDRLWQVFRSGRTRPLEWRLAQLDAVARLLDENRADVLEALRIDLGKPAFEAQASDVSGVISEIGHVRRNLARDLRPERVRTPLMAQPAKTEFRRDPLGVVLVMPAWNYPVALSMIPLMGALAGGNAVLLKPSELAPASSALLARLIPRYLDRDAVAVIEGGPDVATAILEQRFAHIHYTGGGRVGRVVMAAAARHLTTVTLELGGKNPVYLHGDTDPATTAARVMWGRLFNAGQTCLSPDLLLVPRQHELTYLDAMVAWIADTYGPDPQASPDLGRIVNDTHVGRIAALLEGPGEIVVGGQVDRADRYVAPTIVRNLPEDHPLLHEEIFGPVLPVVAVDSVDDAIERINRLPAPLTSYVFSSDRSVADQIVDQTTSGSVSINQVFTHVFSPEVPVGGVGESGMGAYTGVHTIDCFTHRKPVVRSPMRPDLSVMRPPYTRWKSALVRRLLG